MIESPRSVPDADPKPFSAPDLAALLEGERGPKLALLAGAADGARFGVEQGLALVAGPWLLCTPELCLFEPDAMTGEKLVRLVLEDEEGELTGRAAALAALFPAPPLSEWGALVLELAAASSEVQEVLAGCRGEPDPKRPDPGADRGVLTRLLEGLCRDRQVLLYLPDAHLVSARVRQALVDEAGRLPALAVVLGCEAGAPTGLIAPGAGASAARFEVQGLPNGELRASLEELGSAQPLVTGFLGLAARCGLDVPVDLIFDFMQLEDSVREELEDRLDGELVEGRGALVDLGYNHPGFPGNSIYRFSDETWRGAAIELDGGERAGALLENLRAVLPARSVGATRLFLELCLSAGAEGPAAALRNELALWTGIEPAALEGRWLDELIERGELPAPEALRALLGAGPRWPAPRRIGVMAALARHTEDLSAQEAWAFHRVAANTHSELGRFPQALSDARRALELVEQESGPAEERAKAEFLVASLERVTGEPDGARRRLEGLLEREPDLRLGNLPLSALASVELAQIDRLAGAREAALERLESARGELEAAGAASDPHFLPCLMNLGGVLSELGRAPEAIPHLERARDLAVAGLGEGHPNVAAILNQLGAMQLQGGQPQQAVEAFNQALAIQVGTFGEQHPAVGECLVHLASAMGLPATDENAGQRYQQAGSLLGQALAIFRGSLGDAHPRVSDTLHRLGGVARLLGDRDGAVRCLEQALALRSKTYGDLRPETVETRYHLAVTLREHGRFDDAGRHLDALSLNQENIAWDHPAKRAFLHLEEARLASARGQIDEAKRLYGTAVERCAELLGAEHQLVTMTKAELDGLP